MKFKRIISGIIAGAVAVTGMGLVSVSAADTGAAKPAVVKVTFDEGGDAYTLHGSAALADGRDGKALSLDGTSGTYADIGSIADNLAGVSGDFTISVWVNPDTITTWSRIYDFGNGSSGTYVFLTPSNGSVPRLAVTTNGNTAEQQVDSAETITAGTWHNVTITRKEGVSVFYIDGIPTGTSAALKYNFSDIGKMQNYYLGKSQFDADPYFDGMIDDLLVYDYALDESGVQQLAAEAYESIRNSIILQNNCFVVNTNFYDGKDKEIFAYNGTEENGLYVTDKTIENDRAKYTVHNIKNNENDFYNLTAYVAQYDSNGKLIQVNRYSNDEYDKKPQEQPDEFTAELTFARSSEADSVKLFVWNDMQPLSETAPEKKPVTVKASIENDTSADGTVRASVYAVNADGEETMISEGEEITLKSLESHDVVTEIQPENIPSDASKLVVKVQTNDEIYDAATLYVGIYGPEAAPADSNSTTEGAHDPSIVKFPNDPNYYVYSSHHLIFTSPDLINWKKYDFTNINVKDMSPKTYNFIKNNIDSNVNGTYWAPDVIYKEGEDYPYWMYISVSCGLGGRNSAIALVKSDSPLFWADKDAHIEDAGVVFATKEQSGYKTNAIDANIYTDTDGKQYFIWGSFWQGIQAAKLMDNGFVEGVDYTSDASILSSCRNFGTSVYAQKSGVEGPEGAWMINHGDYRYMFTSYGWLGSNYNTRIARSAVSSPFSEAVNANNSGTNTQLTDDDGVAVGNEYASGSAKSSSGYKLIGSYRLGDGSYTIEGNDSSGYYIPRSRSDAHIYYGPGHNSAITAPNGETFYVSHTRKDATEIAATLQVRKMLWTEDGWPVVSPVTYAGEREQPLPEEMLAGTYDLASVGHTKMKGSTVKARNFDLPVVSSKITLNADGTIDGGLGNWKFDGDHTITLSFTANGDESKDEFYKNGDVMTMYALYGYDKDEKRAVVALTGTDQNHVTQFALKPVVNSFKTPAKTIETEPVSIEKSLGGNPELGFDTDGNTLYAGDPAATVIGDTVYLIAGHDTATNESYVMPEWVLYTSKNLTDWEYKGPVMKATDISWRSNGTSAWASQMTEYNGKYYLYFCTWDKTSSGKQSIGVAVADKPEGPYKDALGKPLVSGNFTTPESAGHDDIDPTVLIDRDENGAEHRYLAWGNTRYYVCELNEDMTSVKDIDGDGQIIMHKDVKERKIKSMTGSYTEAPWLYKRDGKYYMFYAMNWREEMAYAMCDEPMGRYDYKQTIMPPTATSNTNHPSVIDFNGKTYFVYHNGALLHGSGFRRSVCIQELSFDENGYVYPLTETSVGLDGTASVIKTADGKYMAHEAFRNSLLDASYPLSYKVGVKDSEDGYNTAWEIEKAKYVPEGENADYYVSIQSVNKPGLYLKSTGSGIALTQDADGKQGEAMTFKTVKGIDDKNGVSFESVSNPNYYLTATASGITLSSTGAGATFYIDNASQKDETVISIAPVEPDPVAGDDVAVNFNDAAAGSIMTLGALDQGVNTDYAGLNLYVGTRGQGGSNTTGWLIENGTGVDGSKALTMSCGRWASGNRGPRVQLTTPPIPDGSTVTGIFKVKKGDAAELYFGDSTGTQGGSNITDKISDSEWSEVKITISNSSDTYTRKIFVNDAEIASDYIGTFPVFWGIPSDTSERTYKVYFDDFSIKTTSAEN